METVAGDRELTEANRLAPRAAVLTAPLEWLPIAAALATVALIIASRGKTASVLLYAFGVAVVAMGLQRPTMGLTALVVASAIDGISKGVLFGWFTLLLKDAVLWACIVRWLLTRRHTAAGNVARLRTTLIIAAFTLWVLAEAANVFSASLLAALAGVRSWVGWVPVFFVAYEGLKSRREIITLAYSAVIPAAIAGAYGVVQSQIGYDHLLAISPDFSYVSRFQLGAGKYRVMSTLPHPGMFGHYMATVLPIALGLALMPLLAPRQRLVAAASSLAIVGGAIASGGRLALASLLTCGFAFFLLARQIRAVFLGAVLSALVGAGALNLVAPEAWARTTRLFDFPRTIERITFPLKKSLR
ncbi:MAG: hypothetical protein H5T86_11685, partial [Armatimonadetes bacterium]|nr:hypothetical protein [Armatimonadota bacterium]